jgi:sRNA-binding carbon storage regulator CsrA
MEKTTQRKQKLWDKIEANLMINKQIKITIVWVKNNKEKVIKK